MKLVDQITAVVLRVSASERVGNSHCLFGPVQSLTVPVQEAESLRIMGQ